MAGIWIGVAGMSKIYLIRHGNTEANELHLYCGSTDLPLSERGRDALQTLKPGYSGFRMFDL